MLLEAIIRERIQSEGPVSFHDFMEMALYYPDLGYYNNNHNRVGAKGDFYTSAELDTAFGTMIARQLEEMWTLLDKKEFTIVEYGAGNGRLCNDILEYFKSSAKYSGSQLNYHIIEKSKRMEGFCRRNGTENLSYHDDISKIPGPIDCVLSNELLDNFPVHLVEKKSRLMEVFVDYRQGAFGEILLPAKNSLNDYFGELQVSLPENHRAEVNLDAIKWLEELSRYLERGFIITIDYGYQSAELYNASRWNGTLLCYQQHSMNDQPLRAVGQQDITAHVNFSALLHWGGKYGLECCGFTNQALFLLSLGLQEYLSERLQSKQQLPPHQVMKEAMLMHTLIWKMGEKFKVLIQQKGIRAQALKGLTLQKQLKCIFPK